ncbi:AMP-binding protein, partial [Stenotrophomonas maltophilia]
MGNEADYVLAYFGALAAGLVALPSSPQLTAEEAGFLLRDADASVVVHGNGIAIEGADAQGRILLGPEAIAAMKTGPARED